MTDRFSIHVDAGYLIARAGYTLHGVESRTHLDIDHRKLVASLVELASEAAPDLELLRLYWYDASPEGEARRYQHGELPELPNVKLRLGRLAMDKQGERPRQKGVDARIVLDLMKLAWDRSVKTAFLLAGDEDLLEGVDEAQRLGVRVVLLSLPNGSVSQLLRWETDGQVDIAEALLRDTIGLRSADEDAALVKVQAERFAREWLAERGMDEGMRVLHFVAEQHRQTGKWGILPPDVNGWLLKDCAQRLNGLLEGDHRLRSILRGAFLVELGALLASPRPQAAA